ncbi:CD59 glycoprotein [Sminthopsis crassicaudata]|uniref:CD59 glycoprotein n=1 Tax=Sminthopsis crassicaudata TaxID=9301 RepID=UPI003D69D2A2
MMANVSTSSLLFGLLVLAMFWSQGDALKCYECENSATQSCIENIVCKPDEDSCLLFMTYGKYFQRCWKFDECNINAIGKVSAGVFDYHCCQHDLCNAAGMGITVSKASIISGLLVLLVVRFLF